MTSPDRHESYHVRGTRSGGGYEVSVLHSERLDVCRGFPTRGLNSSRLGQFLGLTLFVDGEYSRPTPRGREGERGSGLREDPPKFVVDVLQSRSPSSWSRSHVRGPLSSSSFQIFACLVPRCATASVAPVGSEGLWRRPTSADAHGPLPGPACRSGGWRTTSTTPPSRRAAPRAPAVASATSGGRGGGRGARTGGARPAASRPSVARRPRRRLGRRRPGRASASRCPTLRGVCSTSSPSRTGGRASGGGGTGAAARSVADEGRPRMSGVGRGLPGVLPGPRDGRSRRALHSSPSQTGGPALRHRRVHGQTGGPAGEGSTVSDPRDVRGAPLSPGPRRAGENRRETCGRSGDGRVPVLGSPSPVSIVAEY